MALSNIFREPRRELTESAVGLFIMGSLVWGDYRFGRWFEAQGKNWNHHPDLFDGMLLGVVIIVILVAATLFTHTLGEWACDRLAKMGIELRPRKRRGLNSSWN